MRKGVSQEFKLEGATLDIRDFKFILRFIYLRKHIICTFGTHIV